MSDPVIRVDNLAKQYVLGTGASSDGLRHVIQNFATAPMRWFKNPSSGPDPGAPDGREPGNGSRNPRGAFWALKDVSFEVGQGEVLGIIGRNGAGKSTLLKILSRITEPTEGRVEITGRVASLLEVGTGFHPELTGQENVFLNGAILGMSRGEIKKKFDEIVAFAEVEKFLDTPVKRYSSGMYVRLAFAVAAHLEPDILIVDEVLAVGDAQFQKKCMEKMDQVAKLGRTILLVTHQLGVAAKMCNRCLLFNKGTLRMNGPPAAVINEYYASSESHPEESDSRRQHGFLKSAVTTDPTGRPKNTFRHDELITVHFSLRSSKLQSGMFLGVSVKDYLERRVFSDQVRLEPQSAADDTQECVFTIPRLFLAPGSYGFLLVIHTPRARVHEIHEMASRFKVVDGGSSLAEFEGTDYGCVQSPGLWKGA
jgi:lipopolysaccharide transport system ATP-binding protein